jgi:hypothetical protein
MKFSYSIYLIEDRLMLLDEKQPFLLCINNKTDIRRISAYFIALHVSYANAFISGRKRYILRFTINLVFTVIYAQLGVFFYDYNDPILQQPLS